MQITFYTLYFRKSDQTARWCYLKIVFLIIAGFLRHCENANGTKRHGKYCYIDKWYTGDSANVICKENGMHLATITNDAENKEIVDLISIVRKF